MDSIVSGAAVLNQYYYVFAMIWYYEVLQCPVLQYPELQYPELQRPVLHCPVLQYPVLKVPRATAQAQLTNKSSSA